MYRMQVIDSNAICFYIILVVFELRTYQVALVCGGGGGGVAAAETFGD